MMEMKKEINKLKLEYDFSKSMTITLIGILLTSSIAYYNIKYQPFKITLSMLIIISVIILIIFGGGVLRSYSKLMNLYNKR